MGKRTLCLQFEPVCTTITTQMKKHILLLFFIAWLFSPMQIRAEELASPSADIFPIPQRVVYALPYPGILPGNPLYLLKVMRDRVIGFLIADSAKKAEFDLLQADKRLQMGVFLLQKNNTKEDIAFSTIAKGQNYFEEAIAKIQELKKQGHVIDDLGSSMLLSSQKHQEVLKDLAKQEKNAENKRRFQSLAQRMQLFEVQLRKLLTKSIKSE